LLKSLDIIFYIKLLLRLIGQKVLKLCHTVVFSPRHHTHKNSRSPEKQREQAAQQPFKPRPV
jgi:hypothetical protein